MPDSQLLIDCGREECSRLDLSANREWLVTNGLGGYAAGTMAGLLTRRYHGLLVAALPPPQGRTLLLTKLDETVAYDGQTYPLFANRWASGLVDPAGFNHLERFHLEGTTPVWTFACADVLLQKRIWMQPGANTTYIRYDLQRGLRSLALTLKAFVNYRSHQANTHAGDWQMTVEPVAHGLKVTAFAGATPFYLLSNQAEATTQHNWYRNFFLSLEEYRGLDPFEDHLYAGVFRAILYPGKSLTLVASTEAQPGLDGVAAYAGRLAYEQGRLDQAGQAVLALPAVAGQAGATRPAPPDWIRHLVLAADQFVVCRPFPQAPDSPIILAGYPWYWAWYRDTLVALPGLALATGRPALARDILCAAARTVDQGMLPNHCPESGAPPEYNAVDTSLWYVEAIRAYLAATGDETLLVDLFPVLEEIISQYQRGTRYHIHCDSRDGLLYAGEPGNQLTWMDARVDEKPITPRVGKPVEVNALWYNALEIMAGLAGRLGRPAAAYQAAAAQARSGFARFWQDMPGYCYDVLDGPDGHEAALRPNQLLAVSLPFSPLSERQQRAVVNICTRHLYTPHGLRTLAPDAPAYTGHFGGNVRQRDSAYHQGTTWGWLIGPFVTAHLRVYRDPVLAGAYLQPLVRQLASHGLGSISQIFEGDPPFAPRGCIAQAWSVAELLRVWYEIMNSNGG